MVYRYLHRERAGKLLKSHLFSNVVQMHNAYFLQREGIPQVLSSWVHAATAFHVLTQDALHTHTLADAGLCAVIVAVQLLLWFHGTSTVPPPPAGL